MMNRPAPTPVHDAGHRAPARTLLASARLAAAARAVLRPAAGDKILQEVV